MTVEKLIEELKKYDLKTKVYNKYSGEVIKSVEDDEHGDYIVIIE